MAMIEALYRGVSWFQERSETCKEKLHIRDWSEVFIVMAAIYSLRTVIQSYPKNLNALVKNPHFTLFLVLGGAEVRIRQLWVNYTVDTEIQEFKDNNGRLKKQVQDLTSQNTRLQEELTPLKAAEKSFSSDLESLRGQNVSLSGQVDRLEREVAQLKDVESRVNEELSAGRLGLEKREKALAEREQAIGEKERRLEEYGKGLVERAQQLNARQKALDEREEASVRQK